MARSVHPDASRRKQPRSELGQRFLEGLVALAFFVRFFLPAESAAQGETLWIVALWLIIGIVASVVSWRSGFTVRRLDRWDGSVLLLVGGQLISALFVVCTSGDKRAAINMAWEWFGVGVIWFVIRSRPVNASFRKSFLSASIVTGVVLGGFGLWQHYVSHPQMVAEYGPLFDRLRTANGPEAEAIQRKLAAVGIPIEGPALTLFEKRLRDSREPIGLFGLANTFGGCLAVWLVLGLAEFSKMLRRGSPTRSIIVMAVLLGVISICLLLTKSRTALVGVICGVSVFALGSLTHLRVARRAMSIAGAGVGVLILIVALLIQFRGLDREVLSEAPKSLAYRLQYWQATSRLIADHFWLGVGPGNFRQHYLQYKLPEASEEIADPHNLFFDVAATGGVTSVLGLMLLIGLTIVRNALPNMSFSSADVTATEKNLQQISTSEPLGAGFWFAGGGPLLAFAALLGLSGIWEDRLLVLALFWYDVAWLWCLTVKGGFDCESSLSRAAIAGLVTLAVHLLGAGGIAMPSVSQILMSLVVMTLPPCETPSAGSRAISTRRLCAVGSSLALALTMLLATALIPVKQCQRWQAAGDLLWMAQSNYSGAEAAFGAACQADVWAAEPWRRRAELAYRGAQANHFQSNDSFESAVQFLQESIHRDPFNFNGPRTMAGWWLERWRVNKEARDAIESVTWIQRTNQLYPTNASILAEVAIAQDAAGLNAADYARLALKQDRLNRERGHVDRLLSTELTQQLSSLAENSDSSDP